MAVQPYKVLLLMCGQLYCEHAIAMALSSSPVVGALGS